MNIIHVPLHIRVVTQRVLPIAPLPDAALAFADANYGDSAFNLISVTVYSIVFVTGRLGSALARPRPACGWTAAG
jgi:hypothetical protein